MSRIMIVDDTAFMRQMLKTILIEMGHEIAAEATNGGEAVRLYNRVYPDLVTMDITMPEMDGIEALKQIMKLDPGAKVIMCSAMAQQRLVIEAIMSGAKDFISKPFQQEKIMETVTKVLAAGKTAKPQS